MCNMKFSFLLLSLWVFFSGQTIAQAPMPQEIHDHDHDDEHRNELGVALSPVYFLKEEAVAFGLHVHYIHYFGHSQFGLGLGYERIFDEHQHNTVGVVASYRPWHGLSFNVSPGLTFEAESNEANFAVHLESTYEFEFKNIHLGPAFEFAYDKEDIHISLGLHIGFGF